MDKAIMAISLLIGMAITVISIQKSAEKFARDAQALAMLLK